VVPYLAPELFSNRDSYSQAMDVYAFGIIMWEISSEENPFDNVVHDAMLILRICKGLPPITEDTPPFIKRCWHSDPSQRPTAEQILELVDMWHFFRQKDDQIKKADEIRQRNISIKKIYILALFTQVDY
jgi:serine/threonine protein kinase